MAHNSLCMRALCFALIFFPLPSFCITVESFRPPGVVLYRGDTRPPGEIRESGGFLPSNSVAKEDSFGLYQHLHPPRAKVSTQYVSTTSSLGIAISYAGAVPDRLSILDIVPSWVYFVRPTPNFIDATKTMGSYAWLPINQEFSALGGFRWAQVLGWVRLESAGTFDDKVTSLTPDAIQAMERRLQQAIFTPNVDYDPAFDDGRASGAVPQLAGFPKGHPAWERMPWKDFPLQNGMTLDNYAHAFMDSIRDQVRWQGTFPLFERVDTSSKALTRLLQASEAAKQASAEALQDQNVLTASHKAMRAEQKKANACLWLAQLARVFDDHSFLAFEAFLHANSFWVDAREAASRSRWRGQTLLMGELRQQLRDLKAQTLQLAPQAVRVRVETARKAKAIIHLVDRVQEQIDISYKSHAMVMMLLEHALQSGPETLARASSEVIWMKTRETQENAILREVRALRAENEALKWSVDEISRLADEAKLYAAIFSSGAAQTTAEPQDLADGRQKPTDSSTPCLSEIVGEVLLQIASQLPTPAAPVFKVLKWGRRAYCALKVARRVSKIERTMVSPTLRRINSLEKLNENMSRLQVTVRDTKLLSATKNENPPLWKSVDEILGNIESSTSSLARNSDRISSGSIEDSLRELETVQVPNHELVDGRTERPLEELLRDLDRVETPEVTVQQEPGGEAAPILARDTSPAGGTSESIEQPDPAVEGNRRLEQGEILDLIMFRVLEIVGEGDAIMQEWSESDIVISSLENTTASTG